MSAVAYPCQGGPHDGQLLAHAGTSYHVSRWTGGESLAYAAAMQQPSPVKRTIETAEYRLEHVGPDRLAWVFQGWPT